MYLIVVEFVCTVSSRENGECWANSHVKIEVVTAIKMLHTSGQQSTM